MSWQRVVDTYKKKFNKNSINCRFSYEKDFIVNAIFQEFPDYDKNIITAAVIHSCRMISEPRPRDLFFEMVARILTNHANAKKKDDHP